jgi:hypothetical protein
MDDEFGAMAFGGFDDLWKRHGGKGALRHGLRSSEHACSRNRAASSTRPARRLWPTTSPQGSLRFSELQSSRPQAPLTLA